MASLAGRSSVQPTAHSIDTSNGRGHAAIPHRSKDRGRSIRRMPTSHGNATIRANGSFASMDSPGAYETKATEAFYYVTPPEKDWDKKHVEEHMRLFIRAGDIAHHRSRGVPGALPAVPLLQAVPDQDPASF